MTETANVEHELYLQTISQIAVNLYRLWGKHMILANENTKTTIACSEDMATILMEQNQDKAYLKRLLTARERLVEEISSLIDREGLSPDFKPKNETERSVWISEIIKEFNKILKRN